MKQSFFSRAERYIKRHKRLRIWYRIMSAAAVLVVFITTYMLILPAITMEKSIVCGKEEHTHTEACYQAAPVTHLLCSTQTDALHRHTPDCYDDNGCLVCGYADFIIHTHTDACYNAEGTLICTLPENRGHKHSAECYAAEQVLICPEEESEYHTHDASCYQEQNVLVCGQPESYEPHTHTEACYLCADGTKSEIPLCGKAEVAEHVHNETCMPQPEQVLVCGKEEHVHSETCYAKDEDVNTAGDEEKTADEKMAAEDGTEEAEQNAKADTLEPTAYAIEESDSISNENITPPTEIGRDFGEYITGATVQKIVNGNWVDATEFKNGENVRVTLNYQLPAGLITPDQRTIHYQLPTGVVPKESLSGNVNWKGQDIGDYYIGENGMIVIQFSEEFAAGGEAIDGDIYFQGTVSSDNTAEDKEIQFGGDGGSIIIQKETEEETPSDIHVKKTAEVSTDKKTIDYTVTVGTNNGTGKTVAFEDYLKNASYQQDSVTVQKKDKDGNLTEITCTPEFSETAGADGKVWMKINDLPELQAGEEYVITYKADAGTPQADGKLDVENSAGANGTWTWVWTEVSKSVISKEGYYNEDTGKITWTVKINPGGQNLNGFTLSDKMNGVNLEGQTAILKNETAGTTQEITLPYTFNSDTTDTYSYTIVYETEPPAEGGTSVQNDATISKGNESYEAGKEVGITQREWGLDKFSTNTEQDTDGTMKYTWTSNIVLPHQNISTLKSFSYTDTIKDAEGIANSHYGTVSEITQMIQDTIAVKYVQDGKEVSVSQKSNSTEFEKLFTYEIQCFDASGAQVTDSSAQVKSFKVNFIPKDGAEVVGKMIGFQYPTTGVVSGLQEGETITFKNHGAIPDHEKEATVTYKKPIKLLKGSFGTGSLVPPNGFINDPTWCNGYKESGVSLEIGKDGKIYYRLILRPDSNTEDIILEDTLPEGVRYVEGSGYALYCGGTDDNLWGVWPDEGGWNLTEDGKKPIFTVDGQKLKIQIPSGYSYNFPIAVFYTVELTENMTAESTDLVNKVTWEDSSASSTTTITKEKNIVAKTGEQLQNEKGEWLDEVEYHVVINPDGEDLDVNSDTLTLEDTLTYTGINQIYLDLAKVKLYTYDPNNPDHHYQGAEIDTTQYQVTYDNTENGKQKITVKLPDELACVLVYSYSYDKGSASSGSINLDNEVSLMGKSSKEDDLVLEDNSSGANANKAQIKIFKVDSEDYSKLLPGAEFQLSSYHYQGEEGFESGAGWKEHEPNLVTDKNGEFVLEADSDATAGEVLRKNTLYKLTEITPPEGYSKLDKPYYFVWLDGSKDASGKEITLDTIWRNLTEDIRTSLGNDKNKIQVLNRNGGNIYIPNEYTSVGVTKVWLKPDGTADAPAADGIQVQLMRSVGKKSGYKVNLHSAYQGKPDTAVVDESIIVAKNGSVTICVRDGNGQDGDYTITYNGKTEPFRKQNWFYYTIPTVNSDLDVTINVMYENSEWLYIEFDSYTKPEFEYGKATAYGEPVTLNSSNTWKHVWEGLDKTNGDGSESYYYTVKELTTIPGYSTSYTNNGGIQNGEIVITNTKDENSGFELPETGGPGTKVYTAGGILLIAAAILLYINKKKSEGRGRRFTG